MSKTERRIDDRYVTNERFTTLRGIRSEARARMSEKDWNFLWCGTGDETTQRDNEVAFDRYQFRTPLFAGISNPDTSTRLLGMDLSFPAFIAPFGADAVFDPEGHLAAGRAAEASGIKQIVPVASSFTLEEVTQASSAARIFELTFVGEESLVIDMMHRAKEAGYTHLCVTYSPIRQWRERMMEDRWAFRFKKEEANYGPGRSDPATLIELLDFTRPRWTWKQAASVLSKAPLPCIIKGVTEVDDAKASLDAGAAGLYVSNYGGRIIDRVPAALDLLPEIRAAAGTDVPIIFDSGIRRGSDIAAAIALGADAVALGRLIALGLAADGQKGVQRTLELLKTEFWTTLGHLGCSKVSELGPHVFRTEKSKRLSNRE
jgi:4-hydroxymandelate oxidase